MFGKIFFAAQARLLGAYNIKFRYNAVRSNLPCHHSNFSVKINEQLSGCIGHVFVLMLCSTK